MKVKPLFILLAVLCAAGTLAAQEVSVKVMTYNIFSARKMGIQAIADVINKVEPDIVSLQEVERNTEVNPMDFPQEIARLTRMPYYYFAHALDIPEGGDYGNVILSKYPLSQQQTYKLSIAPDDNEYIRSMGIAKIAKDGKEFYFAATHLGYKHDDATRLLQISEIMAAVKPLDKPIVLAGDLNSRRGSATMPALQNFFTVDCLSDCAPWTAPAPNPQYPCDWIIYAPESAFVTTEYYVCYWAHRESDHYPVVAVLKIN